MYKIIRAQQEMKVYPQHVDVTPRLEVSKRAQFSTHRLRPNTKLSQQAVCQFVSFQRIRLVL